MPAWHGTLLPQTDADIWLAAAFADYERIVAHERELRGDSTRRQAERRGPRPAGRGAVRLPRQLPAGRAQPSGRAAGQDPVRPDPRRLVSHRRPARACWVLHELRRLLGDEAVRGAMDSFGREHAGKEVTTAQFQAHVGEGGGRGRWAASSIRWLKRPGLPTLKLAKVGLQPEQNRRPPAVPPRPSATLSSVARCSRNPTDPALTQVEVTVETDQGEFTRTVKLKGERTAFPSTRPQAADAEDAWCSTSTGPQPRPMAACFQSCRSIRSRTRR